MIDTRVAGSPGDIRAAGAYLSDTLSGGITTLADTVVDQRATLQRGWDGEAGAAFIGRATVLARAGDDVSGAVGAMGQQFEALASILDVVQLGMAAVRAEAVAAGLELRGERILPPPLGPYPVGSPELAEARDKATAYEAAATRRNELATQWNDALTQTAEFVQTNATDIAQFTVDLLVAGYSAALLSRAASVMSGQAAHKLAESQRLAAYADDIAESLRNERVGASKGAYGEMDELMARSGQAADEAAEAAAAAKNPKLPGGLVRGLGVLGPLAAGYGFYDDIQSGESREQAAASQGGGLLSGMLAGGATGAAIGSMGFPVVGTVVGGVVGGVTGVIVSNEIDDHYNEEEAAQAEADRQADEEFLQNMLNVSEGLPLYSTPGSDSIYGE